MADRWWDPSGPAYDLLTPGGDTRLDAANALFALHRAGAAALNAAAATPMLDESVISKAADSARAAYAEPVCESLGQTLGDTTYAGLLVRDIADSAEHASLGVYRSCVSKGVPPPIAAQRAALVYGVAPNHLGSYQAVASNPISKDIAVLDAADRAVFAWASTVAEGEIEEISKRESAAQRREAIEDQPRSPGGRWGRRDLASTAEASRNPATIDGMSVEEWVNAQTAEPVVERQERTQRAPRAQRKTRTQRAAPQRAEATAAPTVRSAMPNVRADVRAPVQRMDARNRVLASRDADHLMDAVDAQPAVRRHGTDSLTVPRGGETMPLLNDATTYVMPMEEWRELERAARTEGKGPHESGAVYLTGEGLQRHSGTGAFTGSERHEELVDDMESEFHINRAYGDAPQDIVIPVPKHVVDELGKAANPQQASLMLDDHKRRYLMDYLEDNPQTGKISVAEEVGYISYIPDHHTGDMLFVWRPPNPADPKATRPVRLIAEITVDSRNARGEVDPGTRHGEGTVELDPHSLLRVDRTRSHSENLTYDQDRKVGRVQIDASVADKFRKAESPARRRAAAADQPRDGGRWGARQAPAIDGQDVEGWVRDQLAGTRQRREQRTARTQRVQRATRAAPALVPVRSDQRSTARAAARADVRRELSPVTRLQMHLRKTVPSGDAAPFADSESYTVIAGDVLERHFGVTSQAMVVDHDLDSRRTDALRSLPFHNGDDALEEVNQNTFTDELNTKLVLDRSYAATSAGEQRFLRDYRQMAGRMAVTRFTMRRYMENDQLRIRIKVHDSTDHSEPVLNVLRWNSTNADRRHTLHFQGARRVLSEDQVDRQLSIEWHAAAQGTHGPSVGGNIPNPSLHWWDINDTETDVEP